MLNIKNMLKGFKWWFILLIFLFVILILILIGVYIGKTVAFRNSYYAVYLDTGDLYFGKLSRFPRLELKDVWYIQNGGKNGGLSLNKFSKVIWGPGDEMRLNYDKVVWIVKLSNDSKILPVLEGKANNIFKPQQSQQQPSQNQDKNTIDTSK